MNLLNLSTLYLIDLFLTAGNLILFFLKNIDEMYFKIYVYIINYQDSSMMNVLCDSIHFINYSI